jgi:nitroimidazol reductase NimA-like FMN-containing flavoprotein (pyridoxamine 5'-phosphate oxidase superfamily)
MIEIRDLSDAEIREFIGRNSFGHLACARENVPYLVPIHYVYEEPYVYIFTTQGKKSDIIAVNPNVCLQIEEVADEKNWTSVVVDGEAEEIYSKDERDKALKLLTRTNPELTPAMSIRWMDGWIRENITMFFRITPVALSGRASVPRRDTKRPLVPRAKR